MKVIFVNWTKPFFNRENFIGHKKQTTDKIETNEYSLSNYEIIMHVASVTSAKKYSNCPIKLYTDTIGYEYYRKIGIDHLFDEIDTNVLDNINPTINSAQFWTSGKIISICNENPPFLFIDLDFILKSEIPKWLFDYDVVHTHWELLRGQFFIRQYDLDRYNIIIPEFDETMLIPNTSFLFINNDTLLKNYMDLHMRIVCKEYDEVPDWLWLMSDQHILGYTLRLLDLNVSDIENRIYIQFPDNVNNKNKVGYLPNYIEFNKSYNEKITYEHVWLDKSSIIINEVFRNQKIIEWKEIIKSNGFGYIF